MDDRHVISVLVENKPGVLARIAGMFSGRAFNIHSLAVAPTLDTNYSRMTIVTHGSEQIMEQIVKQLRKLINVAKVQDLTAGDYVGPRLAPAGLGFVTLFFGVGQALGPYLGGYLADATGSFKGPFLLACGISLLGMVLSLGLKPIRNEHA